MFTSVMAIAALVASISASAGETPTQFMERYIGYFNAKDSKQYQETFQFPVIHSVGGVLEILSDPSASMANFEKLKKTGWDTTRVSYIIVLSEPPEAARVEFSFIRMSSYSNPFYEATGHYGLISTDDG